MNDDKRNTPMTDYLRELASGAEMDQSLSAFTSMASLMGHYFAELKAAGFSPLQAMTLVTTAQVELIRGAQNQKGDKP